jgi:hypothetical protein
MRLAKKKVSLFTFPVGGLVNHNVHLFIKGCLTVKFSGSWKTVTGSLLKGAFGLMSPLVLMVPSGEIGMVSRGTGWEATLVIMDYLGGWCEI